MWLPERCQDLGKVNIDNLSVALAEQPAELWDADEHLKQKLAGNRQTRSLFLQIITSEEFLDIFKTRPIAQDDVSRYSAWPCLHHQVQPILDFALSSFSKGGVVLNIQLARMMPGAVIPMHTDSSTLLTSSYRLHVPLKTNSDIHFMVDDERIIMQQGRLYNLNNRVPHWVENRSNQERIHLIIDYLPPENNCTDILNINFDLMLKARHEKKQTKILAPVKNDIELPKVIATSVIRGANQNESHGGIYLVDMQTGDVDQVVDWDNCNIDFSGRGWDRGLRGIGFYGSEIYVAASNELFCFDKDFNIINSYRNPYLKHAHELVVDGDHLYITSTGFDSILRFDLINKTFDNAWLIRISKNKSMQFEQYQPIEPYGPQEGNSLHINNVSRDHEGLYVSGRNAPFLFRINHNHMDKISEIPMGTHNTMKFKHGYLFNDTNSDQVVFTSRYDYASIGVPCYSEDELLNIDLGDELVARQSFGRGLCQFKDDIILAGSSPSTISAYDLSSRSIIKSVNISMDVRNAIHGLEIWPH